MNALTPIGDLFLPYQQRLWAAIDAHQVVVVEKSRRTGFSWAVAAPAVEYASRADQPMDALYMGYEREMTREFIDYCAMWARDVFQAAAKPVEEFVFRDPERPDQDIGAFRMRFAGPKEVVALPSVPRALRGKQGLVILDEAAFMDDLEEVLKAAFALLIWGGKVVIISTHNGETNPFNVLVQDIRAGRAPYHLIRLTFDEAVEEGLFRRVCLRSGQTWSAAAEAEWVRGIYGFYRENANEELRVIPNAQSGAYIAGPLLEARMVDGVAVVRWTAPDGFAQWSEELRVSTVRDWCEAELRAVLEALDVTESHAFGEDFGRVRDLTVVWVLAISRLLVRQSRLVLELRNVPFEQQRQILFYVLDRLPRFRAGKMDAGGNGAYLAEVTAQRYGDTRIEQVKLSEPWYRENMPPMKAAIEDAAMTLPRDRDVVGDIRSLRLVRGVGRVPDRTLNDEGASRHGDAAIAGCLAYAASRADPEEYGYQAASRTAASPLTTARGWGIEQELAAEEARGRRLPGRRGMFA